MYHFGNSLLQVAGAVDAGQELHADLDVVDERKVGDARGILLYRPSKPALS